MPYLLPFSTYSKPHITDGTPHNCYSDQQSVCTTCCLVALTESPTIQTVHRTIAIVTNNQTAFQFPCCTKSRNQNKDATPNSSCNEQHSVCVTRCPIELTADTTIQTVNHKFAIINKICLPYLLQICTKNKPQNTDGTPHNCCSNQKPVCLTCCFVALTVSPKIQKVHRTIAIVNNSQSALNIALLN